MTVAGVRRLAAALRAVCCVTACAVVLPMVADASPAAAAPGPSGYPQWWFDDWDVPGLWADGARGQGITIAELDTGVNADLPELAGKILPGRDFGDPTQDGRVDQDLDRFGHGTAMASLMVAEPGAAGITGLAPAARLLPVALPLRGTATEGPTGAPLPAAIRWAVDNGAQIISLSLGQERLEGTDPLPCPTAEQDAILYAVEEGAIVVAASGNDGETGSPVNDPGVCIGVLAVGAVDEAGMVASFSSRHPYLGVTAPGVDIPTLGRDDGDVFIGAGTSQATAIVSAGLALIWSAYPDLTNDQVVARMLATLDNRVTTAAADPAYGFGVLDVGAAIRGEVPGDAPNPLLAAAQPFLDRLAARAGVAATPPPAPPAVEAATDVPGVVAVGVRPSPLTGPVVRGGALAGAGLLALLVLFVVGVRSRLRTRRQGRVGVSPEGEPVTAA